MVYPHKNSRGYWYIRKSVRINGKPVPKDLMFISNLWQKPEYFIDEFQTRYPNEKFDRDKLKKELLKIPIGILKEKKFRQHIRDMYRVKFFLNNYKIKYYESLYRRDKRKKNYLKNIAELKKNNSKMGILLDRNIKLKKKIGNIKMLRLTNGDIKWFEIIKNKKKFFTQQERISFIKQEIKRRGLKINKLEDLNKIPRVPL